MKITYLYYLAFAEITYPKPMMPELETDRLNLRYLREDDVPVLARFFSDPETMRFMGTTKDYGETWRHVALIMGHWQMRGYGFYGVELKDTGALIGRIGLWKPGGWPDIEIGWLLGKEYWGQGYAFEAASMLKDYAFQQMGLRSLISVILPENTRSINLARRIGETYAGNVSLLGYDLEMYRVSE